MREKSKANIMATSGVWENIDDEVEEEAQAHEEAMHRDLTIWGIFESRAAGISNIWVTDIDAPLLPKYLPR